MPPICSVISNDRKYLRVPFSPLYRVDERQALHQQLQFLLIKMVQQRGVHHFRHTLLQSQSLRCHAACPWSKSES